MCRKTLRVARRDHTRTRAASGAAAASGGDIPMTT
jgi:hypothetical protein